MYLNNSLDYIIGGMTKTLMPLEGEVVTPERARRGVEEEAWRSGLGRGHVDFYREPEFSVWPCP
jgi:hypothetical protein